MEKKVKTKKTYKPPRLRLYGALTHLTKAKGGGANDGGGKPATKASGPAS